MTFAIGAGVPAMDERDIRDGIAFAQRYLEAVMGSGVRRQGMVNVRAGGTAYDTSGNVLTACCQSDAGGGAIYFDTSHPDWSYVGPNQPTTRFTHLKNVAHEYTHLWSYEPGGGGCMQRPGGGYLSARWMLEGIAELVAWKMNVQLGTLPQATLDARITYVRSDRVSVRILEGSAWPSAGDTYGASMAAMEMLLRDKGVGIFAQFCARVGSGAAWSLAFEAVFGETVAQFYDQFDRWLAGNA